MDNLGAAAQLQLRAQDDENKERPVLKLARALEGSGSGGMSSLWKLPELDGNWRFDQI